MIFGRNRNVKTETVILPEELRDPRDLEAPAPAPGPDAAAGAEPAAVAEGGDAGEATATRAGGPYDVAERPGLDGYLDLGSLRVPLVQDLKVRLDVEDSTKRIIGATLTLGQSSLQAQAFAAPRSGGIWDEIRAEIRASVAATEGAQVGEREGPFGTEVVARIPAAMPDGSPGWRVARFLGVDGPRWFLRGVVGGEAAFREDAAGPLDEVFSRIVVARGQDPHPPRDLLPLTPPENLRPVRRGARTEGAEGAEGTAGPERPGQQPPERGPEITEVR
ncbi:DUF3710 domain-containing protein [Citricoccus sp. SGAir0253]|uniref:DUF3710 domain-containing protein n=1 Tax=Citricoccus sp. SGAir0253 TaxID=2567881 RepID=UPI0010CD0E50|nr:DUF3710 domain-containing protein [Citricoccus sp. SGAir0253]QCU77881.1 DUF3710 domain-containing protein [Citricoccus sp. SGAir0253]